MIDKELKTIALDLVRQRKEKEEECLSYERGSLSQVEAIGESRGLRYSIHHIERLLTLTDLFAEYVEEREEILHPSKQLVQSADKWNKKMLCSSEYYYTRR